MQEEAVEAEEEVPSHAKTDEVPSSPTYLGEQAGADGHDENDIGEDEKKVGLEESSRKRREEERSRERSQGRKTPREGERTTEDEAERKEEKGRWEKEKGENRRGRGRNEENRTVRNGTEESSRASERKIKQYKNKYRNPFYLFGLF